MKTYLPKIADVQKNRKWFLIDAENLAPGRIATVASRIIQGKHKPDYTPHLDTGDGVIIINAEKINLSGNKLDDKKYYTHSGYSGHLKAISAGKMIEKKPTKIVELAIYGMLPKTKNRRNQMLRLKVVAGSEHNHTAQKPEQITI